VLVKTGVPALPEITAHPPVFPWSGAPGLHISPPDFLQLLGGAFQLSLCIPHPPLLSLPQPSLLVLPLPLLLALLLLLLLPLLLLLSLPLPLLLLLLLLLHHPTACKASLQLSTGCLQLPLHLLQACLQGRHHRTICLTLQPLGTAGAWG